MSDSKINESNERDLTNEQQQQLETPKLDLNELFDKLATNILPNLNVAVALSTTTTTTTNNEHLDNNNKTDLTATSVTTQQQQQEEAQQIKQTSNDKLVDLDGLKNVSALEDVFKQLFYNYIFCWE